MSMKTAKKFLVRNDDALIWMPLKEAIPVSVNQAVASSKFKWKVLCPEAHTPKNPHNKVSHEDVTSIEWKESDKKKNPNTK